MQKSNLIKRLYRITKDHDKLIKKNKKKFGSESAVIRNRIETLKD